jgi:hypothetical protein
MRNPVRALAAAALLAGPTALAFFSGGFFERPRLIAAIAVWAIVAVVAVVAPHPLPRTLHGRLALAGLALLTAWTALSYEWAPLGERAQADTQRLLLYLGLFTAAAALLRGPAARRWTEPALALGAFAVTCYGLSARLLPTLVELGRSRAADGRLEQPLTYWNGMGCLSAIGLVLCARMAADARRPPALRAAAAFCGPALGLGVYLSFSRGALFALGAGLAALVLLAPAHRAQLRAAAVLVGAGAVAAAVASLLPRVESLAPGQTGDGGEGLVMLTVLLALSAGAAIAATRISAPDNGALGQRPPRIGRRATAAAAVVLALAGIAGVALLEDSPSARPGADATSAKRFRSADTLRYSYWEVALEAFADHPLKGTGSGGFAVEWRRQPDRPERAVDAHSLYIETLAELGLVGAALLALFMGGVAVAAARLGHRDPAAAAGLAAGLVTWTVHAGLDWDWELPALTGVALVLAAAAVGWDDEDLPVC